jgi:predicted nucleic acid-binding protein
LVVRDFLRARFPRPFLRLDVAAYKEFVLALPENEISGGAAYDALVAATAVRCGAELITCDRRAVAVYERYGVRATFLV